MVIDMNESQVRTLALAREALASSFASRRLPQQHWLAPLRAYNL